MRGGTDGAGQQRGRTVTHGTPKNPKSYNQDSRVSIDYWNYISFQRALQFSFSAVPVFAHSIRLSVAAIVEKSRPARILQPLQSRGNEEQGLSPGMVAVGLGGGGDVDFRKVYLYPGVYNTERIVATGEEAHVAIWGR